MYVCDMTECSLPLSFDEDDIDDDLIGVYATAEDKVRLVGW